MSLQVACDKAPECNCVLHGCRVSSGWTAESFSDCVLIMGQDAERRTRWDRRHEAGRDMARIEAFSDAVIAIMLTLLAIELLHDDAAEGERIHVRRAGGEKWRTFCAFAASIQVGDRLCIRLDIRCAYSARGGQGIAVPNVCLHAFVARRQPPAQVAA